MDQMYDGVNKMQILQLIKTNMFQTISYVYLKSVKAATYKEAVIEKFAVFTRKHLCYSLFLIKIIQRRCFPVNIAKFRRTAFQEPLRKAVSEFDSSDDSNYF